MKRLDPRSSADSAIRSLSQGMTAMRGLRSLMGQRRMLFVDFDALGMPVFSPRSAGAWVRIDVFVASMTVAQLSAVLAAEF